MHYCIQYITYKLNKNKDCIYSVSIIAFNISLISSIKTKILYTLYVLYIVFNISLISSIKTNIAYTLYVLLYSIQP